MSVKSKIKKFYRHNKKCVGLWMCSYYVILTLIAPYNTYTLYEICLVGVWYLVWLYERRIDTQRRMYAIAIRQCNRDLDNLSAILLEMQSELQKAYKAQHEFEKEIERMTNQLVVKDSEIETIKAGIK